MKISICGNIGCGKTTVLRQLESSEALDVVFEPVHKWTMLDDFYKDMKRWSFPLQVQVLHSFLQEEQKEKDTIYERSPQESCNIFTTSLYQQGFIGQKEYDLLRSMTDSMAWKPDLVIYLRCDPEICKQRILTRNRECEHDISLTYLEHLHELYEQGEYDYTLDASLLKEEVVQKVQEIIDATVSRNSSGTRS